MVVSGPLGLTSYYAKCLLIWSNTLLLKLRAFPSPVSENSFVNSTATNQYLYLGYVTIGSKMYANSLLLFTTTDGVKLIYGSDADALLVKFIGYKRFAIIRPSLKF